MSSIANMGTTEAGSAAEIAREIRTRYQQLKELMKRCRPWDSEVEFQRQQVRRYQIQLLFKFPSEKESKDAENQLWMTTSHAFISTYKSMLASLDRTSAKPPTNGKGKPQKNVVERRRLVQRFRQFLSAEDKFWRMFISRYTHFFGLGETKPILRPLEMNEIGPSQPEEDRGFFPEQTDATSSGEQLDHGHGLAIVSKALICLGDLTRYREQQGEFSKPDVGSGRGGRGGRHATSQGRHLPYAKSQELYEMARSLDPDIGNSSHQLAIISNYQKDTFNAVYHYYRALCVRHPYETASENLQTTLNKALDMFLAKGKKQEDQPNTTLPPHALTELLKEKVVLLHASWRLTKDESSQKLPNLQTSFMTNFSSLISDRSLPVDVMLRVVVMAIGALWRTRVLRDKESKQDNKEANTHEPVVAAHLLSILTALFRVGVIQISDGSDSHVSPAKESGDLALSVTAVFRRALPALRVGSKWIIAHLPYLISLDSPKCKTPELTTGLLDFWVAYQAFFSNLGKAFPPSTVPVLANPLEEDVDMCGFVPLKKAMAAPTNKTANGLEPGQSMVHPNEEHLMRISDLIRDANSVANNENSPIRRQGNHFTFKGLQSRPSPPAKRHIPIPEALMIPPSVKSQSVLQRARDQIPDPRVEADDDGATVSTRTDDDPVNLAMKATLDSDADDLGMYEEDDIDEVLYPKKAISTPIKSFATTSPRLSAAVSPILTPTGMAMNISPTTLASNNFSNGGNINLPRAVSDSAWTAAAQPPLLFGSGPGEAHSIWSTSHDLSTPSAGRRPVALPSLSSPTLSATKPVSMSTFNHPQKSQVFRTDSPSNFIGSTLKGSASVGPPVPNAAEPYGVYGGQFNSIHQLQQHMSNRMHMSGMQPQNPSAQDPFLPGAHPQHPGMWPPP